jgi:glutathione S-transferase
MRTEWPPAYLWTLYTAPGTCAQAVHIALNEAGAELSLQVLDLASNQQRSASYLTLNPRGRVPALVTEQGVLTETPALLSFIARQFPAAGLAPLEDPFALARLESFNSFLCSTVHVAHAHKRRGHRWADEPDALAAMQRKVAANMAEAFAHIERDWLGAGPWLLGERFSTADPYLFTLGEWLAGDGVDESAFPRLLAHRQRMLERPAVRRARAELAQALKL